MPVVTLAHLSDVHLAPISGFTPGYWNVKRLLGFANWQRGRKRVHQRHVADQIAADVRQQGADHIAVSGDLSNLGLPAEFKTARTWLQELGPADRVSVVPGNHDIYTSRMFGASCVRDWAPWMTSNPVISSAEQFPYVRRIGHVALIGINSAVPTPPFIAAGCVGDAQLQRLEAILSELSREADVVRVVMIHHPPLPSMAPKSKELRDAAALQRVLEVHGADLVLHGHNHTDTVRELQCTAGGRCLISGVPSASAAIAAHESEPLARYHIYKISGRNQPIERIQRGLNVEGGPVLELGRV